MRRRPSAAGHLAAARTARRLARAALPVNDVPQGGRRTIADLLYREAARRCVCVMLECDTPSDVEQALVALSPAELAAHAGGPQRAVVIRRLFRGQAPTDGHADVQAPQPDEATVLKSVADALIRRGVRDVREYPRLLAQIGFRWLLVVTGVAALSGAVFALSPLRRLWTSKDLLAGATWKASSAEPGQGAVEGGLPPPAGGLFFFHTGLDESPSLEIEIPGPPVPVSRVVVDNRTDCCGARALPLSIELSTDRVTWDEVARRSTLFERWSVRFTPRTAHWIRLRVLRRSNLHLQNVAAYR